MAPPGTIITSQIQQAGGTGQAVVSQVVAQQGQPMQQLQQIQVSSAPQQQQTQPQQQQQQQTQQQVFQSVISFLLLVFSIFWVVS